MRALSFRILIGLVALLLAAASARAATPDEALAQLLQEARSLVDDALSGS